MINSICYALFLFEVRYSYANILNYNVGFYSLLLQRDRIENVDILNTLDGVPPLEGLQMDYIHGNLTSTILVNVGIFFII